MSAIAAAVIVFLIAVNAFYVLAEFASVSVRRTRVRQLATEGSRLAGGLLPIVEDSRRLDRYIAVCQVGITLSSLILGAYAQATIAVALAPVLSGWVGEVAAASTATAVTLVALTGLQVLFGELLPKSIALQSPVKAALATFVPMRWSEVLLGWFTAVLNGSGLIVLRAFGVRQSGSRHLHSPEEIDLIIAETAEHGLLEPVERLRLHRALRLTARTAQQLMAPRVEIDAINLDDPPDVIIGRLADSRYTRLPVYHTDPDQIVGIVHVRDVVNGWLETGTVPALEALARPALFVPETVRADRLITLMREERTQLAVVIDETGGLAGIISIQDVLRDVLGPLADEFKPFPRRPEMLKDGRVRLPGQMRLHEAEPHMGVLWRGEAVTVGGRVIEALGRLPRQGERLEIDGVEVEVERAGARVVRSLLVRPVRQEEPR